LKHFESSLDQTRGREQWGQLAESCWRHKHWQEMVSKTKTQAITSNKRRKVSSSTQEWVVGKTFSTSKWSQIVGCFSFPFFWNFLSNMISESAQGALEVKFQILKFEIFETLCQYVILSQKLSVASRKNLTRCTWKKKKLDVFFLLLHSWPDQAFTKNYKHPTFMFRYIHRSTKSKTTGLTYKATVT
jgi:hypothetical protein